MKNTTVTDEQALTFHLMHPGGDSAPGDPNPAYCLDGTYHLHYILRHPWKTGHSYSFVHVTSTDMLHWTWQPTKLQPSFTGHGMFSGTGFITKEGKPAAIYAGLSDPRHTFIAVARNNNLSSWEEPYPVLPKGGPNGEDIPLLGDPDCFRVGDTYYAFSAADGVPLCKSSDLVDWTYVGRFMSHEMPDVAIGEDVSCANFFKLGDKWMLLCISHPFGCRYYLGDWDAEHEQFVPESHGRMNWRRPDQSLYERLNRDFFAPESVLTPDGRRVMWAWLVTLDPAIAERSIQSLPRELSLGEDGRLRIKPLQELESLRFDGVVLNDVMIEPTVSTEQTLASTSISELNGDSFEIRITVDREEALRKRLGVQLFADESHEGLPILFLPEYGKLHVGTTEAPFSVGDLPVGEDLVVRIFVDKYLVEVFVNDRQAVVACHMDYLSARNMRGYSFHSPTVLRKVEFWRLQPTNQGFLEARENRIWKVDETEI